jgi:hypothetical protein
MNQHRGGLRFVSWSSHPRRRRSLGDVLLLALPVVLALSWAAWNLLQRGGQ